MLHGDLLVTGERAVVTECFVCDWLINRPSSFDTS